MNYSLPGLRCGILGGGQLGRMMAVEARRLGIYTTMLDPADQPPAFGIADQCMRGSLYEPEAIKQLADQSDVLSYEIEHVNTEVLKTLEAGGKLIYPRPGLLELIQDKLLQKQFLASKGIPVPVFKAISAQELAHFKPETYPFVQKARRGGYDGKGVTFISSEVDLKNLLPVDSMIEEAVDLKMELAVLVARGRDGQLAVYDLVEMVFDERAQICDMVCAPARISAKLSDEARKLGIRCIEALDGVGLFAVELFLSKDNSLLVNEIAPRPHNSGHWTIEGAVCNQFEQHLRSICSLPLGDPSLVKPSVMVNLLGDPEARGLPILEGLDKALAMPGFHLHWYQKAQVSPFRKMGHWTICADSLELALERAQELKFQLKVLAR